MKRWIILGEDKLGMRLILTRDSFNRWNKKVKELLKYNKEIITNMIFKKEIKDW